MLLENSEDVAPAVEVRGARGYVRIQPRLLMARECFDDLISREHAVLGERGPPKTTHPGGQSAHCGFVGQDGVPMGIAPATCPTPARPELAHTPHTPSTNHPRTQTFGELPRRRPRPCWSRTRTTRFAIALVPFVPLVLDPGLKCTGATNGPETLRPINEDRTGWRLPEEQAPGWMVGARTQKRVGGTSMASGPTRLEPPIGTPRPKEAGTTGPEAPTLPSGRWCPRSLRSSDPSTPSRVQRRSVARAATFGEWSHGTLAARAPRASRGAVCSRRRWH